MATSDDIAAAVIQGLAGTSNSWANLGEDLEGYENDLDVTALVDDEIFCCAYCNWWCWLVEQVEQDGDLICSDCAD